MRTTTLRYVSAMPALRNGVPRARLRALGTRARRAASTASGNSERLLDLRDDAVRRVEELLLDLGPATDVADLEELRARRELRLVLLQHRGIRGTEPVLGPDRLRGRCVEPVHELFRLGLVAAVDRGERRFDLKRRLRDQVEDGPALRLRELRVAFVVEKDVALARQERVERVAPTRVLRDVVLEELLQVRLCLLRRLLRPELCAVGRHDVPLCAPG